MKPILLFGLLFCAPRAQAAPAWEELAKMAGPQAALSPLTAPAPSPDPALAPRRPRNVLPSTLPDGPLIVVHATRSFDEEAAAAAGIDAVVARYKAARAPVVYLLHEQTRAEYALWYTRDRAPDYELFSEGGEHNLPLSGESVTVVGGFFGSYDGSRGCHTLAVRDAIRMHFEASSKPFTVHMPVRAIYFYEADAGTREQLLSLDVKTAGPDKLHELFDDFARLFFLTDNFSEVPAFGHPYLSGAERRRKDYREGASVDVDGYTFDLFFDEVPVASFGHGPRRVSLKLSRG